MYDHAEAARRRVVIGAKNGGAVGAMYVKLANTLMQAPDFPTRTAALKKLADSCDSAMALTEKVRQSRGNSPDSSRSPQ
jgi:hypothetical protein